MSKGLAMTSLVLAATLATPAWPADTARGRVVQAALERQGTPYRFGGTGPDGFDCSGLVQYSYRVAGLQLPRTTVAQRRAGRPIPLAQARPADLLFYRYGATRSDPNKPYNFHVAIYLGDGRAVHAPSSGGAVEVIDVTQKAWRERFVAATTLLGTPASTAVADRIGADGRAAAH